MTSQKPASIAKKNNKKSSQKSGKEAEIYGKGEGRNLVTKDDKSDVVGVAL